jgi:glycosyltransferase involved in cell wall biosynthesis
MLVEGLVSTIIPVHNRPLLLREAVASVLAQTYRPIEIVIVDDGSTDDTAQSIVALAAAYPSIVRHLRIPNRGPGAAREAGRVIADGEFIQYLDSDDLLLPRKFEQQVGGLRAHPECDVAYGRTRVYRVGEPPGNMSCKRTGERIGTMFPSFLQSRWWDTSTPLYRREVTDLAGPWTELRNEEDWEYDCRIASKWGRLHYCDAFVSDTRIIFGYQLSAGGSHDPDKLRSRARAHRLILEHALAARISHEISEMQHFARELFLLARQCGAAGLPDEARILFQLARQASGPKRSRGIDFVLYGAGARLVGWRAIGSLTCGLDRLRA